MIRSYILVLLLISIASGAEHGRITQTCHEYCSSCIGPGRTSCTACHDNASLDDPTTGQCFCNAGFYDLPQQCTACPSTCETCAGATTTTSVEAVAGVVNPLDYGFTFWPDKWFDGSFHFERYFQTGYYGFILDVLTMSTDRLGMLSQMSINQAMKAENSILTALPTAAITYFVQPPSSPNQIQANRFLDDGSARASSENPSRLQEMGRFMQKVDMPIVKYADREDIIGFIQISSMPRHVVISHQITTPPSEASMTVSVKLEGEAVSHVTYSNWTWVEQPRAIKIHDDDGNGWSFVVYCTGTNPTIIRGVNSDSSPGSLTFTCDADLNSISTPEVNVIAIPSNAGVADDLQPYLNPDDAISVKFQQIKRDGSYSSEQIAPFDPKIGCFRIDMIDLKNIASGLGTHGQWATIEQQNWYNRHKFSIENKTSSTLSVPLAFYGDTASAWTITGGSPMIRFTDGQPSGIPVQISKNWHYVYWFSLYTLIELGAGTHEYEHTFAHARWGKEAYAVQHSQLCLSGWGSNQQWDQSSIGAWGESITYDPDMTLNRSMVDDVRPFLTEAQDSNGVWNWTGNVGGANFLMYQGPSQSAVTRSLGRIRTMHFLTGPNLTNAVYTGISRDGKIYAHIQCRIARTDDLVRAYYTVDYEFLQDVTYTRLAFWQMATDNYGDNGFRKYAYGNAAGATFDGTVPTGASTGYLNGAADRGIELTGDSPWVFLYDSTLTSDLNEMMGNIGFVVRDYRAVIGANTYTTPHINIYQHNQRNHPQVSFELGIPYDASDLTVPAGSTFTATVEYLIPPAQQSRYYGSSDWITALSSSVFQNAEMGRYMAAQNTYVVVASVGTVNRTFPIEIASINDTIAAIFSITDGLGLTPVSFTGLTRADGWQLEYDDNGIWTVIDQAVLGNDYWQAYYDVEDDSYTLTYNVLNRGTIVYRLVRTVQPPTLPQTTTDESCLTCKANASIPQGEDSGACTCDDGYYGTADSCAACDALCLTCSAAGSDGCTTCHSNASMTGSSPSACACDTSFEGASNACNRSDCVLAGGTYDAGSNGCVCTDGKVMSLIQTCEECKNFINTTDLTGCQFSADFLSFTCTFANNISPNNNCNELFTTTTYNKLGISPTCAWQGNQTLVVTIGESSTLFVENIELNSANVLLQTGNCSYNRRNLITTLTKSADIPVPDTAFRCIFTDNNKILCFAAGSKGALKRQLEFKWDVKDVVTGTWTAGQVSYSFYKPALSSVEITLSVRNTLGGQNSYVKTIALDELHVEVEGSDTIFSNKINVFTASASNSSATVDYTWQITSAAAASSYSQVGTQTGNKLVIQADTLTPDTYTANVIASDGSLNTTQEFTFTVQAQNLVVKFDTGDTTVPVSQTFQVDARQSYDPSNSSGTLSFTWKCAGCLNASGTELLPATGETNGGVLQISSNTLANGSIYNVECTISKDTRTASRIIELTASSSQQASVKIHSLPDERVHPGQILRIETKLESSGEDLEYTWQQGAVTYLSSTKNSYVTIQIPDPAASSYTVSLLVGFQQTKINFIVSDAPQNGLLELEPTSGTAMDTDFTMMTMLWESENLPLSYVFGINGKKLTAQVAADMYTTKLPPSAKPEVKACDSYDVCSDAVSITATISATSSTKSDIAALLAETDDTELLGLISSFAESFFILKDSDTADKETLLASLSTWINNQAEVTDSTISAVIGALDAITNQVSTNNSASVLSIVSTILSRIPDDLASENASGIIDIISRFPADDAGDQQSTIASIQSNQMQSRLPGEAPFQYGGDDSSSDAMTVYSSRNFASDVETLEVNYGRVSATFDTSSSSLDDSDVIDVSIDASPGQASTATRRLTTECLVSDIVSINTEYVGQYTTGPGIDTPATTPNFTLPATFNVTIDRSACELVDPEFVCQSVSGEETAEVTGVYTNLGLVECQAPNSGSYRIGTQEATASSDTATVEDDDDSTSCSMEFVQLFPVYLDGFIILAISLPALAIICARRNKIATNSNLQEPTCSTNHVLFRLCSRQVKWQWIFSAIALVQLLLGAIGIASSLYDFSDEEWSDFERLTNSKWIQVAYMCACAIMIVTIANILIYVTNDAIILTVPLALAGLTGVIYSALKICTIWWTLMFLACGVVQLLLVSSILAAVFTCVERRKVHVDGMKSEARLSNENSVVMNMSGSKFDPSILDSPARGFNQEIDGTYKPIVFVDADSRSWHNHNATKDYDWEPQKSQGLNMIPVVHEQITEGPTQRPEVDTQKAKKPQSSSLRLKKPTMKGALRSAVKKSSEVTKNSDVTKNRKK